MPKPYTGFSAPCTDFFRIQPRLQSLSASAPCSVSVFNPNSELGRIQRSGTAAIACGVSAQFRSNHLETTAVRSFSLYDKRHRFRNKIGAVIVIFYYPKLPSRITDIRLRKSFQKRPIGNITVCNRKSPVFGIYVIARLYAIFFLRFSCAVFPHFF